MPGWRGYLLLAPSHLILMRSTVSEPVYGTAGYCQGDALRSGAHRCELVLDSQAPIAFWALLHIAQEAIFREHEIRVLNKPNSWYVILVLGFEYI